MTILYLKTVADVECGVSKTRSGKIVNGVDAVKGEFPWQLNLIRFKININL